MNQTLQLMRPTSRGVTVNYHPDLRDAARLALNLLHHPSGGPVGDVASLTRSLYRFWYGAARSDDSTVSTTGAATEMAPNLTMMFRLAHAGQGRWESGFEVTNVARDGRVVARRGDELRLLDRVDYFVPLRPGTLAHVGDLALVTSRRDRIGTDQPWWYTFSAGWVLDHPPHDLIRVYWHPGLRQLPSLVHSLTDVLTLSATEWMLKCAIDPTVHERADACVLYLPAESVPLVVRQLEGVAETFASSALSDGPPMTRRVSRGCSLAMDPGTGESFGEHRCRLIAEAILNEHQPPDESDERDRLGAAVEAIVSRFDTDGIDSSAPWQRRLDKDLPWTLR
jgi:HopA1 effector protein family